MSPNEELLVAEALEELRNPGKTALVSPSETVLSSPLCSPRSSASFSSFDRDFVQPAPYHRAPQQAPPQPRSMFGNMILTATSMLLPRDTQHRLRTLVRMLRLANDSLSRKVVALKDAMDQESRGVEPELSANALRQDVVATVKKSTSLIGSVAGNSLPQSARFAVRKLVLTLPAHWRAQQESDNAQSAVLSLASETLYLIRDVITIVDDTLDRAENWCGRLGDRKEPDRKEGACSESDPKENDTPDMESLVLNDKGKSASPALSAITPTSET